jgi:transketolase
MRETYCETLMELADGDARIVLLEADLMGANGTTAFRERFPKQFFNVGVAEANMVSIAAGLARTGRIPFAASFATFSARRAFDQFFVSANYGRNKVNLVGTDPGISAAYNGGTHMCFEDIGMMRSIPGLTIYEPADNVSLKALVKEAAYLPAPTYCRLQRRGSNSLYAENQKFALGKGIVLRDGVDMTIIATGFLLVPEALKAADALQKGGISAAVIDLHTIKPLDEALIMEYAKKTGAILTCENHQAATGVGSAIALFLSENYPVPVYCHGIREAFGEVGSLDYLKKHFQFDAEGIAVLAGKLFARKGCRENE